MEKAINLCDVGYRFLRCNRMEMLVDSYERIYIGSYFCDRYFLMTSQMLLNELKHLIGRRQKQITLVIPIPSETNLPTVKHLVNTLLKKFRKVIDTVVVNDVGMLYWMHENSNVSLMLGRLFSKSLRDPRYPDTLAQYVINEECELIMQRYHCVGIEVEGCFQRIERTGSWKDYKICIHTNPFYMSCMRQCFFASIPKQTSQKFVQNASCRLECSEYRLFNTIPENTVIHRVGKGIYFSSDKVVASEYEKADILIEMPMEMW